MAADIMQEVIQTGSVSRGWLGIGEFPYSRRNHRNSRDAVKNSSNELQI